ncbi:MAG: TfoX/Sxy family protein [Kiloniellales bacterium]
MSGGRDFVDRIAGQLLPLGPVEPRRMFGGWGLFLDGVMFALIARDRLYLKADAETAARFEDAGCAPFTYQRKGKTIALSYREAPADAVDNPDSLLPWAELAVAAARRNRPQRKSRRRPR